MVDAAPVGPVGPVAPVAPAGPVGPSVPRSMTAVMLFASCTMIFAMMMLKH
jgi:hypothetical protein